MNNDQQTSARIYQVNLPSWSPPVMVVADSIRTALQHALDHHGGEPGIGTVMISDETEAWLNTNLRMHAHSIAMLDSKVRGVVEYCSDEGWLAVME